MDEEELNEIESLVTDARAQRWERITSEDQGVDTKIEIHRILIDKREYTFSRAELSALVPLLHATSAMIKEVRRLRQLSAAIEIIDNYGWDSLYRFRRRWDKWEVCADCEYGYFEEVETSLAAALIALAGRVKERGEG